MPIGVNDLHRAAHARSEGLTLVTNNIREFARVDGLRVLTSSPASRREIPTVFRSKTTLLNHFGGFLLQRDCPEEKGLVFAATFPKVGNFTVANQPLIPPGLTISPQADTAMSCRRMEKIGEDRGKGKWVCAFLPRPEGRGLTRYPVNWQETH